MSIALSEFWTRLVQCGIEDPEGCHRLAAAYGAAHQGTPAGDAQAMADFLVQAKYISAFQSRCLLSPTPAQIRFGRFVQTSDKPSLPLKHWLPVRSIAGIPGTRRTGFLLRVPASHMTDQLNQWLAAHASVVAPGLQPFELYGAQGADREVFTRLVPGKSLFDLTKKKMKVARRQTLQVGVSIANALQAMHDRSLVHGEVRADRVWIDQKSDATLLRDPSSPPRPPRVDQSLSWIDASESPGAYAAPEFADPNAMCTPATDIYSLGCLLFRMAVGRLPVTGESVEQEIAAHLSVAPAELTTAIEQGEAGDPILRVIAFAMAKNPAARFASAGQVAGALNAVLSTIPESSASKSKIRKNEKSSVDLRSAAGIVPPTVAKPQPSPPERPVPTQPPPTPQQAAPTPPAPKPPAPEPHAPPPPNTPPNTRPSGPPVTPANTTPEPVSQMPPVVAAPSVSTTKTVASSAVEPPIVTPPAVTPPAVEKREQASPAPSPPVVGQQAVAEIGVAVTAASVPLETGSGFAISSDAASVDQPPPRPQRKRRKRNSKKRLVLAGLCVPVLGLMVMLLVKKPTYPERKKRKSRPPIPAVDNITRDVAATSPVEKPGDVPAIQNSGPDPGSATVGQYQLADDVQLLWAPPYQADTPNAPLDLLPPGPAVIVSARLNQMINDPTGEEVIRALSPELFNLIKKAADRAHVDLKSIERCSVALHPGNAGWPQVSMAIELVEPRTVKELTDKWEASKAKTPDGATIYAGDDPDSDAYYLGDSQQGSMASDSKVKRFAVGSVDMIKSVAEIEGSQIALPRALENLWKQSSVESDVVALVTPNFLFADGRAMMESVAPQLSAPLKSVMIPDFAGVLFSAKVAQGNVFTQFSATPSGVVTVGALKGKLKAAIESWPSWAEEFIVDSSPDRSWRLLAFRLPQMMRFFVQHTRYGQSGNVVIANNYMPANAASQISVATLLAMNTQPGQAAAAMAATEKPLTVDQILDRKMTVSFEAEDLNFAVKVVLEEFESSLPSGTEMPPLRIVGGDLEAKGITQNQTVRDFAKRDLPFRQVLTDLLLGANPDKTATGADDPKQALVWVVVDKPGAPGGKEILITTRAAADSLYELPPEFVIKK